MTKTKATAAAAGMAVDEQNPTRGKTMAQMTWHRLLKNKGAVVGMVFLVLLVIVTILSGFIYDYNEDVIKMSADLFQGPSLKHWFGTDQMGRDIFTRILYGARYSLTISVGSVAVGVVVGLILGSLAGFYGGVIDQLVMRANDILYAIPVIMLSVVIVQLLGTSIWSLLIALSISCATGLSRIARASVMTVRDKEFIESAYAMGLPTWKIILKHVIPNCLSPIIVQVTLMIGSCIIAASSLSFLGVGISAPAPEWGAMLSDGRQYMRSGGWMCIFPGLSIMLTVLALNLLGDGLRDALDPKLKK